MELPTKKTVTMSSFSTRPLVVKMNMKKTIKQYGDNMQTSEAAINYLSAWIHTKLAAAVELAKFEGRKTVLDRDIIEVLK